MKRVGIAELRAHLSEYLRQVRRGHVVVVSHRQTPIARIVPFGRVGRLEVRQPAGRFASIHDIPRLAPLGLDGDVVAPLLDERQNDR